MENLKRVSEVIPPQIYPDAEVKVISEVLEKDIILKGFELLAGDYGDFAIILFSFPNDEKEYSLACGGKVIIKKLSKLANTNAFPVIGKISEVQGKRYKYYDLV